MEQQQQQLLQLQPQMVRPQLYISSARTELYRELLEQNGITHVLQVGIELSASHPQAFHYLQLPVYDMPEQDIVGVFPEAFAFMDAALAAGGGVLVHCQAGISRSATVMIAYVMRRERLSADAATALVSAARSVVWPNAGFKCQLQEFERLGWDASRWGGWGMAKFLSTRYGDESVDFMAALLGGAPQDRVSLRRQSSSQVQQQYQQQQGAALGAGGSAPDAAAAGGGGMAPRWRGGSSSSSSGHMTPATATALTANHHHHHHAHTHHAHHHVSDSSSTGGLHPDAAPCLTNMSGAADQRPASRSSPEAAACKGGRCSDSDSPRGGACSDGACRQAAGGNNSVRRYSMACYCNGGASPFSSVAAGGIAGAASSSSGGHRLRRHSTGQEQQYAMAAAAAGVRAVQLGALKQLAVSGASYQLPEEAALLMAG